MVYIRFIMPRKTKKQKIVSDYRRRLTELEFRTSPSPRPVRIAQAKPNSGELTKKEVDEIDLAENKKRVIRDLRKTILWSSVAISAEVVLYFVT